MGCGKSKLRNEDTVRRCKDRRRLMKEAVYACHHLATAHSDYCRALRLTGSALVRFASGEPLAVSDHTPAVLLHTPPSTTTANIPNPPSPSVHPPPPPQPPTPLSATSSHHHPPPIHRKRPIKLPHILSDSSLASSPPPNLNSSHDANANYTYTNTPSQVSSVWDWDNFYAPPSPPNSELLDQLHSNKTTTSAPANTPNLDNNDHNTENDHDDKSSYSKLENQDDQFRNPFSSDPPSYYSSYSPYSDTKNPTRQYTAPAQKKGQSSNQWKHEEEEEEEETEREEVQCSDWGDHDHYSTTSSSSNEDEETGDHNARSDFQTRSHFGSMTDEATKASGSNSGSTNANLNSKFSSKSDKPNLENDDKASFGWGGGNQGRVNSDRRIMVRHKDLSEIAAAINEYFVKAASSGEQVLEILEIGRAQLDQLKKTVYHSSGILSRLSSSWTSKPPLAVKYQFKPSSFEQSGGTKSLCSTLDRLLAWEKKLYQEVKAREDVKIDHEKKLSSLQNQEWRRGGQDSKLDKTKVSINKLQSLMVVTSQAVSTTSSAIIGLRDSDLVPQIVELCHGFMYMWRSMHQFHEIQNDIVQQVQGLIVDANKGVTTSALHKQTTRDLESAVSAWHSSFCCLIKYQRDFVHSLHGWFKLTLLPVQTEPINGTRDMSEVFAFCDEWKHALDRVPDTVASEAIKSFINVVHSISVKQAEELKIKKRTETASKELEKKSSSLRHIERKFYQSYSTVGLGGLPDTGPDNSHILDARDPLAEKKAELATCQRLVEDEMLKHTKAVELTRALTLNNIQTGLPGVFQAMTSFSAVMTEALETACARSYAI